MNNISINIQKILIRNNITITELADRLNLSRQRTSYILLSTEDKNWKISNLKLIADALNIDLKDLIMEVIFNEIR